MSTVRLNLVVAACSNRGIGKDGQLPWRIKGDMAFFKRITTESVSDKKNAVIMGRKTWESIPNKFKPLPNRVNIVISNTLKETPSDVFVTSGFNEAVNLVSSPSLQEKVEGVYIIGGHSVYKAAMEHPNCHRIYLTQVEGEFDCDTFLPPVDKNKFSLINAPEVESDWKEENSIRYKFEVYEKVSNMPSKKRFNIMVAMEMNRGIANKGSIPWPSIREDYGYYMKVTSQVSCAGKKAVNIKGRLTWDDSGVEEKSRPNLVNIIVSNQLVKPPDKYAYAVVPSLDKALDLIDSPPLRDVVESVWVMGGSRLYEEALRHRLCHAVCLTKIHRCFESDRFLANFEDSFTKKSNPFAEDNIRTDNGLDYEFCYYEKNLKTLPVEDC